MFTNTLQKIHGVLTVDTVHHASYMQIFRKSEHEQWVDFHIIKASEIILVNLMWSGSSVLFTMPFDCMDCSLVHTTEYTFFFRIFSPFDVYA